MSFNNVSTGTLITDGLRIGPDYPYRTGGEGVPVNVVTPTADISSNNQAWGPSAMMGPYTAWTTYQHQSVTTTTLGCFLGSYTTGQTGNLLLQAPPVTGSIYAVWFVNQPTGQQTLQLWAPTSIAFHIEGGNNTTNMSAWVFGRDWYNQPVQMKYINLQKAGDYSPSLRPDNTVPFVSNKTFYQIDRVFLQGTPSAGITLSVYTSGHLGLPYYLANPGGITASSVRTAATGPVSELGVRVPNPLPAAPPPNVPVRLAPLGTFIPGDTTVPTTSLTGDPRGTYQPFTSPGQATVPITEPVKMHYYVVGADTQLNQFNAAGVGGYSTDPAVSAVTPALNYELLYGVKQYYTGTFT